MYNVQFPGFGINIPINPIAFKIGNYTIAWYGILIASGFLLAFLYAMKSCKRFRMDQDKLIDAVLVGILGGIIGARLYFVLFSTDSYYIKNPLSILDIRGGGLGIYGGIIGGLLCGALIAKLHKLSVPAVLDIAALGFLIGQTIGRWGNFTNQEAFGSETSLPWRMVSENTEKIASGGVHPCFLYESLWCLLGFVLLHIFSRKFRRYDGQTFLLYVLWYGAGRFFIEGLRMDSLLTPVLPLRISQVVAAVTVLAAAVLLVVFRNRTSLTGCGSAKIMELNAIVDEIPKEEIQGFEDEGGSSTIFSAPQENGEEEPEKAPTEKEEEKPENLIEEAPAEETDKAVSADGEAQNRELPTEEKK
jgi:phosphatidylglycerol---prolipoprotein diacylglyceryl transferase